MKQTGKNKSVVNPWENGNNFAVRSKCFATVIKIQRIKKSIAFTMLFFIDHSTVKGIISPFMSELFWRVLTSFIVSAEPSGGLNVFSILPSIQSIR